MYPATRSENLLGDTALVRGVAQSPYKLRLNDRISGAEFERRQWTANRIRESTIEQQLERLQRHLELQGEPRLTENVFRDDGYSGANLNRPGLDRLRDRVKDGTLDRVLITSPDRLARNYVHQIRGRR